MDITFEEISGERLDVVATRGDGTLEIVPGAVLRATGLAPEGAPEAFALRAGGRGRGDAATVFAGTVELRTPRVDADRGELLLMRCGDGGLRVAVPHEASTDDTAVYRIAASPGPVRGRGWLSTAGRWVVQRVVFPVVDAAFGPITDAFVGAWERQRRPHRVRLLSADNYRIEGAGVVSPAECRRRHILLLIHGTNSLSHSMSGLGSLRPELVVDLVRAYEGHVLAFDHPTLATDPVENARWLYENFLSELHEDVAVDVLAHSRGGLVARLLAEEPEAVGGPTRIRSVNLVATPNRGTPLADAEHLGRFVDRVLSLADIVPDNPVTTVVEGVIMLAKQLAVAGVNGLDGLAAMNPSGAWLRDHLAGERPAEVAYRALVSDFEPAAGSGLWHAMKDAGVDLVFGGDPNDAMVPVLGGLDLRGGPGEGLADMVVIDQHEQVAHSGYFAAAAVQPALQAWLDPAAAPRPPVELRHRYTPADVESLAKMGPEWSVAGIVDLTCFAPSGVQPVLAAAVKKLGARLWSFASGRGDEERRPVVVFAPGIMGSELAVDGNRLWLSPWRLAHGAFGDLRVVTQPVKAVEAVEPLCFAYRQILEQLTNDFDVVASAYDWRLAVQDSAGRFATLVRGLLDEVPDRPVHVVAHSMGGLVARHGLGAVDGPLRGELADRGGRIVLLGTPNHGSFATPLALQGSHPVLEGVALLDLRRDLDDVVEIVWTFPGLLDMMPDPALDTGDEEPPSFLFDVARWPDRWGDREAAQRALDRARKHHQALDGGAGIHLVVGDGVQTPVGARPIGATGFEVAVGSTGDGTVSHACAALPHGDTWYVPGVAHGDLVKDRHTLRGLVDLLERGDTALLRKSPTSTGRGAAPPEARWLTPAAAGQAIATATGAGAGRTRGAATAAPEPPWSRDAAARVAVDAVAPFVGRAPQGTDVLRVRLIHGDLEWVDGPVYIGHAAGTPIAGAESQCDTLLGGALTRLHQLGLFPDTADSFRYVPKASEDDRLPGCVVLGLDTNATLTPGALTRLVERATIDYVERWNREENVVGDRKPVVSAVPVGSGPVFELGVERSVVALCEGVVAANRTLRAQGLTAVERLTIVDRYAGKVERAGAALARLADRWTAGGPATAVVLDAVTTVDGARPGMPSAGYDEGRWERLAVDVIDGEDAAEDTRERLVRYRFARARAAVDESPRRIDAVAVAETLVEAVQRPDRTLGLGAQLFEELLPVELKQEFAGIDNLVLQVDPRTADLPWEMLVDRHAGIVPLVRRVGMVRQFRAPPGRPRPVGGPGFGALVIGDPPTELPRLGGARSEALTVRDLLTATGINATALTGADDAAPGTMVRPIRERLWGADYRIIHVAAHGLYRVGSDGDTLTGGVAIGPGAFLTAEDFANLRVIPEFVFLNCCHLGRIVVDEPPLGLLGPAEQQRAAAGLAARLMRAGVRAVVVAGWQVDDDAAVEFARCFYSLLAEGAVFGDAVRDARAVIYERNPAGDNTWAAYQCYGDPGLRLRPGSGEARVARVPVLLRATALRQATEVADWARDTSNPGTPREELAELEQTVDHSWPDDAELLVEMARARADLGDFERAIDWYERALACESGGAPIAAVGQLANLGSRAAVEHYRRGDAKAVEAYGKRIKDWVGALEVLAPTSESAALDAGYHKRMAIIGTARSRRRHLEEAIRRYVDSAEKAAHGPPPLDLYGFRNALQLTALAAEPGPLPLIGSILTKEWVERWEEDLESTGPRRGVWERLGRGDSILTAALVGRGSQLAERLASVGGAHSQLDKVVGIDVDVDSSEARDVLTDVANRYRGAASRGCNARAWRSVIDHIADLADLADRAKRRGTSARLRELTDQLRPA